MSHFVRYSKRYLPIISANSCRFEGEYLPEQEGGSESAQIEKRTRFLIFEGEDLLDSGIGITPADLESGWRFSISVRVPCRADRCKVVFEKKGVDGLWEEVGSDDISIFEFPSGWIRSWSSPVLARYHQVRAGFFKLLGIRYPRRSGWAYSEQWKRFSLNSDGPGPRGLWSQLLSDAERRKIWGHVHNSNGCFGSLFQYEGREVCFDKLPLLETAGNLLPKLTVVTPSFNQGSFIGATMDSVTNTAGAQIDYIVMDGGSSDDSVELIRKRSSRLKFWRSAPDNGQAAAIAEGFHHTDCGPDDVMAYLNSDDLFCPGAIDFVLQWFALHPDIDVVYGHRIIIDEAGKEVGRWVLPPHDPEVLALVDFVPQETLFWRKRVYDEVGGIDPSFQFAMDWDFLLKLKNSGARFERLPWFLGCFRVHRGQKTHLHLTNTGADEIALLRQKENGDIPSRTAIHAAVIKTSVESFWYAEKISEGKRL